MRLLFSLVVALFASASAFSSVRVPMEADIAHYTSKHWMEIPASPADSLTAAFMIRRDREVVKDLETELLDRSNPKSKNYGNWFKKADLIEKYSPSEDSVKIVTDYVKSFGVPESSIRVSDFRDKVFVTMPVSVASSMLDTSFSRWTNKVARDVTILRTNRGYSLPEDVASVVALVDDIVRFPTVRRHEVIPASSNSTLGSDPFSSCGVKCKDMTTPDVLEQAYKFSAVSSATKGNGAAVAEFQYQYYDQADIDNFNSACGSNVNVDVTIGGNKPVICNAGCVEALLDIEYIGAIIAPIPLTTIYSSTFSLADWVDTVTSQDDPQWVQSVSYGNDEVQQTSAAYMESVNTQFMSAGALGISILFASGDQGVWGRSGVGSTFHPDFPGGSPYVTAVGGTNFAVKSVIGEESAWSCGGGGFSDEFDTPSWQQSVVTSYLAAANAAGVLPASTLYNAGGRGYPDVSALGGQTNPYCVAVKGGSSFGGVAGTSASCPVVAGIITQLNNVRLAAGKSSLGWLNQWIYSQAGPAGCFNDVNDGSENNCNAGTTGFAALPGWDPATGWGTPNYSCLVNNMS
jgi:tripeptidyl-peptidase-1